MNDTKGSERAASLRTTLALLSALIVGVMPRLVFAHHPMGGKTPATLLDGLLSGLAHPVIGLDHLAMILLAGAYCGATRQGLKPVVAFVGAGLVGCLVHAARWDLPQAEKGIAASLVLLGIVACALARPHRMVVAGVLGAVGILHGYAYGESIVGAEPTPLVAYLVGLTIAGIALGALAWRVALPGKEGVDSSRLNLVRALGIVSAAIGVAALT